MNNEWQKPILKVKDVEKLRKTIKVGDKFTYNKERVVVVAVYRHLIQFVNVKGLKYLRTITLIELIFNNLGLIAQRKGQE